MRLSSPCPRRSMPRPRWLRLNSGKHVLCEMPLAANLEEADQIIDAAAKASVILMPGLTFRFTPNYVKAKQLYDEGLLGNLSAAMYREFIPAKDLAGQWPAGSWVWNLDASGGPLYTLAVWSIDLMRWIMNTEITQFTARASTPSWSNLEVRWATTRSPRYISPTAWWDACSTAAP